MQYLIVCLGTKTKKKEVHTLPGLKSDCGGGGVFDGAGGFRLFRLGASVCWVQYLFKLQ